MAKSSSSKKQRSFQNPKGTRDFFPEDQLRQRYITDSWRRVALRHGFDEIDGPTFEHLDLYTVKSGDGIISELFSFQRHGGDDTYALRPEFTPTLARMYAARAKQLATPVKWFSICNYFRAERPQRGRLREFMQLNCDVIGLGGGGENAEDAEGEERKKAEADGELVVCCVESLITLGLRSDSVQTHINHREAALQLASQAGVSVDKLANALLYIDALPRTTPDQRLVRLDALGLSESEADGLDRLFSDPSAAIEGLIESGSSDTLRNTMVEIAFMGYKEWLQPNAQTVRGLAYYTGTVFEAIAEGERAVAGGGRYDNLIELMGGQPTPAAGFAMGDVVLGNILDDRGLIPDGRELLEALSRPMPVRPDVFVVAAKDEAREQVVPLVAKLRRGVEADDASEKKPWDDSRYAIAPLHARRSYRSFTTKNQGKILAKHLSDASACHARFCVILEDAQTCSIKDLDRQLQTDKSIPIDMVPAVIANSDLSAYF